MAIPRGIRNNNPLNIRRSKDQWKGLAKTQNDREFCQFETAEWGWRAAFCLLTRTYFARYRLQTIRQLVGRWAPESENDTKAYVASVSRLSGIAPDEPLGDPAKYAHRWMLVGIAMATHENGTSAIDWCAMLRGWGMMDG